MLIEIFIYMFTEILSLFASLFPGNGSVPLLLPYGLDGAVSYVSGLWSSFLVTFPYAIVAWHMFLWVVLPFEFLLLVFKLILGSRLPVNHIN